MFNKTTQEEMERLTNYHKMVIGLSNLLFPNGLKLDIACGYGLVGKTIKNCISLDFSRLALTKRWIGKKNDNKIIADVLVLPFRNDIFDIVIGLEILEHLTNPKICIAEIFRVLKVNGYFIASFPASNTRGEPGHYHTKITRGTIQSWFKDFNHVNIQKFPNESPWRKWEHYVTWGQK